MKFIFKCEPSTKIHQTLTKFKTRLLLRREKKQRKKRRKGKSLVSFQNQGTECYYTEDPEDSFLLTTSTT